MEYLEPSVSESFKDFLVPIDENWQPADFLPDSQKEDFFDQVKEMREIAKEVPDDLWIVLVGNTITEEALPTYESWIMTTDGVDRDRWNGWSAWARAWTAEENRHGDLLNRYLYLSGRVNMREVEVTIQHLLNDGFDAGTMKDPYRSFVYTSFQEIATNISHRRTASLAKKSSNALLAKICGQIAGDENRHAAAYKYFIKRVFEVDPSNMMVSFCEMMKSKITMPGVNMRESKGKKGALFTDFSEVTQRLGIYTSQDYLDILKNLIAYWDIGNVRELNAAGEKARDYLMALPGRLEKIAERAGNNIPTINNHEFKWMLMPL